MEAEDLLAYHDAVAAQVAPIIAEDTRRLPNDGEVTYYQGYMRNLIEDRRNELDGQLNL
jgi:hypothetical protein